MIEAVRELTSVVDLLLVQRITMGRNKRANCRNCGKTMRSDNIQKHMNVCAKDGGLEEEEMLNKSTTKKIDSSIDKLIPTIKSASKRGLKKIVKEVAKEGASEIARLGTEKLLEQIDNISNKARQKGAPAQQTDTVSATIKKCLKTTSDSMSSKFLNPKISALIDDIVNKEDEPPEKIQRKDLAKNNTVDKVKIIIKKFLQLFRESSEQQYRGKLIVILILDLLKDCGTINDNDYEILYKAIE